MDNVLSYCVQRASELNSGGRVRVYSVATNSKGHILSEALNSYVKTSPVQAKYAKRMGYDKAFLHSEVLTLTRASKTGECIDTLYIARVDRQGNPKPALPCPICSLYIKEEFPNIKVVNT